MWELDYKENWALKNWCLWTVVLEKTLESPLDYKQIQPVHPKGNQSNILWKDWCCNWNFSHLMRRTDSLEKTDSLGKLNHWEWSRAGGEGDDRGWDGWMASLTKWTWIWVNSGSWLWTGRASVLGSIGWQRVGTWLSDWTELNWYVGKL